jgi:hypothetical protein
MEIVPATDQARADLLKHTSETRCHVKMKYLSLFMNGMMDSVLHWLWLWRNESNRSTSLRDLPRRLDDLGIGCRQDHRAMLWNTRKTARSILRLPALYPKRVGFHATIVRSPAGRPCHIVSRGRSRQGPCYGGDYRGQREPVVLLSQGGTQPPTGTCGSMAL